MIKPFYKSWTFWFGLAQVLYGGAGYLSGQLNPQEATTLVITGLGTIGFRFKTTSSISLN